MICDADRWCKLQARWQVSAAYEAGASPGAHRNLGAYPRSMARACDEHLGEFFETDMARGGSTRAWLVEPL